jgi:outer membrane protein assembly factor BamB
MYRLGPVRLSFFVMTGTLALVFLLTHFPRAASSRTEISASAQVQNPAVLLRWSAQAGVVRYRLQVANDAAFTDVVLDRVVNANEYEITDLPAGRYYWRVAPLTGSLGQFSRPSTLVVSERRNEPASKQQNNQQAQKPSLLPQAVVTPPASNRAAGSSPAGSLPPRSPFSLITAVTWHAAVGDVQHPVLAHLRSSDVIDVVAISGTGVTSALDALTGKILWSAPLAQNAGAHLPLETSFKPLLIPSARNTDDVIVLLGSIATRLDGATGRELWRRQLPVFVAGGVVWNGNRSALVFVVDSSLRGLSILNAKDGAILAKAELPAQVVGMPVLCDYQNTLAVMFAYDNGLVEIRDRLARLVQSSFATNPNTTPPLFINSNRTTVVVVGTKNGVIALDANTLHPVSRINLTDDAPRGALAAADLDGDANMEVIILTDRGRVVASHADGKIVWQSAAIDAPESVSFADVNRDGIIDVIVTNRQTLPVALSGRDGSILWQEAEQAPVVNRPSTSGTYSLATMPMTGATLVIAPDPPFKGLRGVQLRATDKR